MKLRKFFYRLTVLFLSAALFLSGSALARGLADSLYQKRSSEALAARVADARPPLQPTAPIPPENRSTSPTEPTVLPEYAALFEENPDLVGWLTIEGTKINYPVMQTPDRPDHYLYRNFKQEQSAHGCLYVRESCDVFAPSDNLTVYGHHMRDGTMLAGLDYYKKQSFYEQLPYITFDTLWGTYYYRVFGIFTVNLKVKKDAEFDYRQPEYESEEAFLEFIKEVKERSYYDNGVQVKGDDRIITLSTCTYPTGRPGIDNARLVMMARLCTPEEEAEIAKAANN